MKVGGQILWNVTPICETSQIYNLMGRRPYERRFGQPFKEPIIPFGSLVECYPLTAKDQSRNTSMWKESLTWIVPRIHFVRGWTPEGWRTGCRHWGKRWTHQKSTRKDSMRKRWYFTNKKNLFRSRTENIHLDTGRDQFKERVTLTFLENQKGLFHNLMTHFRLSVKLWTIFGPCREASYIAIALNPESNFYSPREESFPISFKYIDVTRTTHANLDVKQEKRIDDYWNIDGSRDLSDPWTGFTQFTLLDGKAPDGYMWSGWD